MNRVEFMRTLEKCLRALPKDEIQSALQYYNEYFDEAGPENEEKVIEQLPPPQQIASKILAEFNVKEYESDKNKEKKKNLSIWTIIFAVLSAPITVPFAIVFITLIFVLLVLAFCFLLVPISISVAIVISCVMSFAFIIPAMMTHTATGIFLIGYFLCSIPLSFGIIVGTAWLAKKIYFEIKKQISKLILRRY